MSMGAMPGVYLLNVYSKVGGARGHERNVGKLRVEVRPVTQCLDLDRYEYDLYRYEYSENTGQEVKAKSFDTGNIINRCYGQDVKVEGKVSSSARWTAALLSGLRDGVVTGLTAGMIESIIPDKNSQCNKGLFGLVGKKACPTGQECNKDGKCVTAKTDNKDNAITPKTCTGCTASQTCDTTTGLCKDNAITPKTCTGCTASQTCDTTTGLCKDNAITPKTCTGCTASQTCDTTTGLVS